MLGNKVVKQVPLFIVITKRTIHHEGDQRSRDYPGHGYGAYSEEVDSIAEYYDEESLKVDMLSRDLNFVRVYKVTPVTFTKNVSIAINS